ncbi:hypothetical protein SAMN06265371_108113 [Lutibacter agarilyticus]|uniref:TonB protein C-terminal n=1 Tax=Lutibacter agarilyticus TaxID=1109740 RepID=A0A238Y8U3_9FLAO|nr:hypothetical protein [Lutibacter agarilyticus]SNR67161.1 hypothetical protein SAMN06265371_108113 [Lutibacter agarilyticus]
MKKIFTLLFICTLYYGFSQQIRTQDSVANKGTFWEKHSKPSFENTYTNHFKQFLNSSLIASADVSKSRKTIILQFNLDKNNKIINLRTNSKNKKLNNSIINAFLLFSLEELNLPEKSVLNNYALQIISRENNKPVLKCSSILIYTTPAIFDGCKNSNKNYSTLMKCNNRKVSEFISSNFDSSLAKRAGLSGTISIYAKFVINKDTKRFTDIKVKAPNDALKFETKRILYNFPEIIKHGYLMGKPANINYSLPIKQAIR